MIATETTRDLERLRQVRSELAWCYAEARALARRIALLEKLEAILAEYVRSQERGR